MITARKIATLKKIIQHLQEGEAPEAVKSQLREMVRQTTPSEIMAMENNIETATRRKTPLENILTNFPP